MRCTLHLHAQVFWSRYRKRSCIPQEIGIPAPRHHSITASRHHYTKALVRKPKPAAGKRDGVHYTPKRWNTASGSSQRAPIANQSLQSHAFLSDHVLGSLLSPRLHHEHTDRPFYTTNIPNPFATCPVCYPSSARKQTKNASNHQKIFRANVNSRFFCTATLHASRIPQVLTIF